MDIYKNKREIELWAALKMMFCDDVPGHGFRYMITFKDANRITFFGKTWADNKPYYYVDSELNGEVVFDGLIDQFLVVLFDESCMKPHPAGKRFYVWEEN